MSPVPIERLSSELRSCRLRLIRYEQRARDAWLSDLEAYDRMLLDAAAMLGLPSARSTPAVPLEPDPRAGLEEGLAEAGLEVRTEVM